MGTDPSGTLLEDFYCTVYVPEDCRGKVIYKHKDTFYLNKPGTYTIGSEVAEEGDYIKVKIFKTSGDDRLVEKSMAYIVSGPDMIVKTYGIPNQEIICGTGEVL